MDKERLGWVPEPLAYTPPLLGGPAHERTCVRPVNRAAYLEGAPSGYQSRGLFEIRVAKAKTHERSVQTCNL